MRLAPPTRNLLLDPLPRDERAALLATGTRAHFRKGAMIFAMETDGDSALMIESGRVRISVPGAEGRQTVLTHLGPGDVVGELAVLDGGRRSANAEAATDVTGTIVGRAALTALIRDHPEAALALIRALGLRLRTTNETISSHVTSDGASRLAKVLVRLFDTWAVQRGGQPRLETAFSQSELGDMAGLTRESVNRILRRMERNRVIGREGKHIVLLDRPALEDCALGSV